MYVIRAGSDMRNALAAATLEKGYSLLYMRQLGGDLDDIYSRYFERGGAQ
jgi:ABC-2 type transport system ATP-binding protein